MNNRAGCHEYGSQQAYLRSKGAELLRARFSAFSFLPLTAGQDAIKYGSQPTYLRPVGAELQYAISDYQLSAMTSWSGCHEIHLSANLYEACGC